jgi:hypothetical protein
MEADGVLKSGMGGIVSLRQVTWSDKSVRINVGVMKVEEDDDDAVLKAGEDDESGENP